MSIDRIISESLNDRAGELKISEYKYEAMLEYIEGKAEKQREKTGIRIINTIKGIIAALHFKDLAEVAVFILVLVAIPVLVNRSNSIVGKSSASGETNVEVKQNNIGAQQNLADLKLSPAAALKYLQESNYEIVPNTQAQAIIVLPDSFNAEKGGIKTGEMLRDRNEISKGEASLDFSQYLGKTVYTFTARVRKAGSQEKNIVILAYGDKIIGLWTGSSGEDYNFLNNNLGEKIVNSGSGKEPYTEVKLGSEASSKYLKDNNYDMIPNSGAGEIIQLPDSFTKVINGIKIGEALKDRNERSKKEASLDFSQYLGKKVYLFTATVTEGKSVRKDIVILSWGDKVIGAWSDPEGQANEWRQPDFIMLVNALKQ